MLMRLMVLRACRWLTPALALAVTTSFSFGQGANPGIPVSSTGSLSLLRGPPLAQRAPVTVVSFPFLTINPQTGMTTTQFFSTGVPAHQALYPDHNNIGPLSNGSLQPGFVYNLLPPSAVGGSSGGIGGGIGGISGGIGGGIGGIGGGIGGISGGIGGGIGGIGGGIGGIGGIGGGGIGGFGGFAYPNGGSIGGGNSFQGGLNSASLGITGLGTANTGTSQSTGFGGFGGGFGGVLGALGGRGF
jgi:hypothetical protein